jgi:hypothetical protein
MQIAELELTNLGTNFYHSDTEHWFVLTIFGVTIKSHLEAKITILMFFYRNFVENDFTHFYCAWSCVVRGFLPLYLCQIISNCE